MRHDVTCDTCGAVSTLSIDPVPPAHPDDGESYDLAVTPRCSHVRPFLLERDEQGQEIRRWLPTKAEIVAGRMIEIKGATRG